jgi:protein-disulfide isomerase
MKAYEGRIRLIVKHAPYKYRDFSRTAAEAALAAGDQGKFWEMHHLLLKNSPRLDRPDLFRYAREAGLDMAKFTDTFDRKTHSGRIDRDLSLAASLDLYSTPTFYINGRKVIGSRDYDYLRKIVDEELSDAGKK